MSSRLEGKIAIVTGGSRGIGAAIAEHLASEGARVVIASRRQEALDEAAAAINARHPGAVHARACHTGRADEVEALVEWTERALGVPDVLVNNAATNPYFGPLLDAPEDAWDKTFEVNLKGYFTPTRAVARRLIALDRPGSIINVTSVVALRAAPFQGVYAMTKAAVISMTQTLAVELGGGAIRVNAIAPGLVDTRFAATITGSDALSSHFTERAALRRFAQPEEISGAVVFLASDEASFVTGQTFAIDGGFTAA